MYKSRGKTYAAVAFFTVISIFGYITKYALETSEDISGNLIRFHVLANSNSTEDIELKYKVKDEILKITEDITKNCTNVENAKKELAENLQVIADAAAEETAKNGFSYPVSVSIENERFPTKSYGLINLPAGKYDALRIFIGEGKGENWWCILYPDLCYDAKNQNVIIDEKKKDKLKQALSDEEFALITEKNGEYKMKFKILELLSKIY